MTTQTTEIDNDYIPGSDEVEVQSGTRRYRFSEGQIVRGRSEDGSLEVCKQIVGKLVRISIEDGVNDQTGVAWRQFETDIQTRDDGVVGIKCDLLDKAGKNDSVKVSCITFAEGILDCALGEIIVVSAAHGEPDPTYGKRPTYGNVGHVTFDPVTGKSKSERTKKQPHDPTNKQTVLERWSGLESQLRAHPAYKQRERKAKESGPTHFSELCKEMAAKGFYTPEEKPKEWLAMASKALKLDPPKTKLDEITDDQWGTIRQATAKIPADPPALIAWLKKESADDVVLG